MVWVMNGLQCGLACCADLVPDSREPCGEAVPESLARFGLGEEPCQCGHDRGDACDDEDEWVRGEESCEQSPCGSRRGGDCSERSDGCLHDAEVACGGFQCRADAAEVGGKVDESRDAFCRCGDSSGASADAVQCGWQCFEAGGYRADAFAGEDERGDSLGQRDDAVRVGRHVVKKT